MSGGTWDYINYRFNDIAEDIQKLIDKNGVKKTDEELLNESWRTPEWYDKYPEDSFHYKYSEDVIEEFKKGLDIIRKANVYIQRIDYLIAGDDGDESFLKRLKEELLKSE